MNKENIKLDKLPAYIPICSGALGGGLMGLFCLGIKGLCAGILLGFIIGILFYIGEKMHIE